MNKKKSVMKDSTSTFEKLCEDPEWKKDFEEGYRKALLSDILVGMMEEEGVSVRQLEKSSGVSKSTIQKMRSGEQANVNFAKLLSVVHSLGYTTVSFSGPGKEMQTLHFGEKSREEDVTTKNEKIDLFKEASDLMLLISQHPEIEEKIYQIKKLSDPKSPALEA